ncbi:MAG TPA: 4Fe-4S binding protein [Anaerolineaceae bacterium]|nr:4Fe-4S binding protein [Anaerolineaceae bacterium]
MTIATKLAKKRRSKTNIYRPYVQAFFFVLIAFISINHSLAEAGKGISWLSSASLHALCPFGGVVTLYQFFTSGTLVQKVHDSSLVLMVIGFVMAIIAGPIFCGWVCPMGTFQEWIGKLGKRIFGKRYNHMVPEKWDKRLRYLRYLVAIWVVYMTARSLSLVFANVDPYFALFNFWSSEVALGGLVVLGVTMLLSLVVERPWCKYACPYGAVQGLFNPIRLAKLRRNNETCIQCGACDRTCPMNIQVSKLDVISNHQCISCMECTSNAACPIKETVEFRIGKVK